MSTRHVCKKLTLCLLVLSADKANEGEAVLTLLRIKYTALFQTLELNKF